MTSKEDKIRRDLISKMKKMMERTGENRYKFATLGKKFAEISIPSMEKGLYPKSKIGLRHRELVALNTAKNEETYAIYLGPGRDTANPDNQENEYWFLAQDENGIHYYGNLLTESDLAELGIQLVI